MLRPGAISGMDLVLLDSAVVALGEIGHQAGVAVLTPLLTQEFRPTDICAAEALCLINCNEGFQYLTRLLLHSELGRRIDAAMALRRLRTGRALIPLTRALGDENKLVQEIAASAIARIRFKGDMPRWDRSLKVYR